jgi:hypothetical protein
MSLSFILRSWLLLNLGCRRQRATDHSQTDDNNTAIDAIQIDEEPFPTHQ